MSQDIVQGLLGFVRVCSFFNVWLSKEFGYNFHSYKGREEFRAQDLP